MVSTQSDLGVLHVKVVHDNPGRIYYGIEEVTGKVVLKYEPRALRPHAELFGPLDLEVVLRGKLKAEYFYETRANIVNLFRKTFSADNGPFRADAHSEYEFPFAMSFPETADPREHIALTSIACDSDGTWKIGNRVTDVTIEGLPPSLSSRASKNNSESKVAGHETGRTFSLDVSYTVSANVQMPGVAVVIEQPSHETPVLYESPKVLPSVATALSQRHNIEMRMNAQDESLVPEHQRPHGLKGKTKAFLKPVDPPKYLFNIGYSVPQNIFVGQQLAFDLYIVGKPEMSSVVATPEIALSSCTIGLIARTTSTERAGTKESVNLDNMLNRYATFTPPSPFSKSNEYRKSLKAGILSRTPSSFTHAGVDRSYTLRIATKLIVAEQTINVKRDFKVVVHPPCQEDTELNDAGSSNLTPEATLEDELPPAYEEVVAGPSNNQEIQPSYEEAVAGRNIIYTGDGPHEVTYRPTDLQS